MSSALDRAKSHFSGAKRQHIDVPEWGEKGAPFRVHFGALSVAQRRRIWRDEAGNAVDGNIAVVRAVLLQGLDASGNRLFDDMDEHALMHEVDSEVVSRIGARILNFVNGAPVTAKAEVEAAKNG